jgi:hypothetical protein
MRVDLEPAEARRLTVMLAAAVAADRDAGIGTTPGSASAAITAENYRILDKLRPACEWDQADPIARGIAAGALNAAGL